MSDPIRPNASIGNDERHRQQGLKLVIAFAAMVRIGRSYKMSNQVVRRQLETLVETLQPMLDEHGEAVIVPFDSDLYLNGVRVPINAASFKFHRTVLESFQQRGISGVSIERGVELRDLVSFFELFLQKEGGLQGHAFVQACGAAGVMHVLPATHASVTAPDPDQAYEVEDDASFGFVSGDGENAESEAPAAEETGPGSFPGVTGPVRSNLTPEGSGRQRLSQAVHGARSLLMTTSLQSGLEMRHAKRVVQPLVDGAFASEPLVVGLTGLTNHDEYTYAHAVSVCAIAVTMGHFLGLDRRTLADLGVAALLHDVGKGEVSERIQHSMSAFTPEERAAAEQHPALGARLIARTTGLNPTTIRTLRVALEHHACSDGTGYPQLPEGWNRSLLSQLVMLADCYVSLQTQREEGASITPYETLGKIFGPLAGRFEPALLWALIQSVGIYPPGQMVELDDGSLALVLGPNRDDPTRPSVRVLFDTGGRRLAPPEQLELRPLPETRTVRRALSLDEYPKEEAGGETKQAA